VTVTSKDRKWLDFCVAGAAIFGTCSRRQYFAVVLDQHGRVVGTGWNGAPPGMQHCVDGGCPRAAGSVAHGTTYDNCVANHAEENALLYSDPKRRQGGTLVVNGPPCWQCSKSVIAAGIKRVVYLEDPAYADWPRGRDYMTAAGIELVCCER
jgi:dCMP deaminase